MSLPVPEDTQLAVEAKSVVDRPKERRHRKPRAGSTRGSHRHHRSDDKKKKRTSTGRADASVSVTGSSSSPKQHTTVMDDDCEDWEANRAAVERLCAQYPNNVCADCGETGTRWASVNHGVFVCIRCSGVHRSLGVHISKVKSTNMDRWFLAEVRLMEAIGNTKAKALYEARLPAAARPSSTAGAAADDALRSFIHRKYAQREFSMHNLKDVLGRLYKDTRYGRLKRVPRRGSAGEGEEGSAPLSTRGEGCVTAPVDRATVSGRRGETMRAFYGDAAKEMQWVSSKRNKDAAASSLAASTPKPTYGAFGMVNVPPEEYEARWQRTLALFTHIESPPGGGVAAQADDMSSGDERAKRVDTDAVAPKADTIDVPTDGLELDGVRATPPAASASLSA
ncbi:hypothetical protein JKF63_00644 [Porcisia hertigi]|uniref:Arf-GAP domain-containing protein n=1 Tax=Porcisia hertigi TaxID=2761500 RepID=A0A836HFG7_9TRYP|nr:hypothetical protein JKF63_00644 [Porcisia hertigi]